MAMASYGEPRYLDQFRELVYATPDGGFQTEPVNWSEFAPARRPGEEFDERHANLAASVQTVLEEVLLDLCAWLYRRTGSSRLALAGGVALNCVANTRLLDEGPLPRSGYSRQPGTRAPPWAPRSRWRPRPETSCPR